MGFVGLKHGGEVRFDDVVRVHASRDAYFLETKTQGRLETTSEMWAAAFDREFVSIIPAQPGTAFLTPVTEEDGSTIWDEDVVLAWGLRLDGYVTAIGTDGVDEMDRAILHPSGKVSRALVGDWGSKESYIASMERGDL